MTASGSSEHGSGGSARGCLLGNAGYVSSLQPAGMIRHFGKKYGDMMINSVVFDLDGTLLDTSEGVISSVKKMLERCGLPEATDEQLRGFIGPPINKRLIQLYGISEEDAFSYMNIFRDEYIRGDLYKAVIYPGMAETLRRLREDGLRIGVATYKREDQATALLAHCGLAPLFDVIHGADADAKLTKADVLALTVKELGFHAENTAMVGDSTNDAVGAAGAGTPFIGVTYGFGFSCDEDIISVCNSEALPLLGCSPDCPGIADIVERNRG